MQHVYLSSFVLRPHPLMKESGLVPSTLLITCCLHSQTQRLLQQQKYEKIADEGKCRDGDGAV